MNHRKKRAALFAASGYIAVMGLGLSLLRAAQQTRRTLYGGQPVMAQLTQTLSQDEKAPVCYQMELGGGEWSLEITLPARQRAEQLADALPPCSLKLLLRMLLQFPALADQTAVCIKGM